MVEKFAIIVFGFLIYCALAHHLSYTILKNKTLKKRKWDLNICCGRTDGGGINADIKKHKELPNFVLIRDVYNLPFTDRQFEYVLCSRTIEHVDDPKKFYQELKRVGKNVTLVIPPLWDISAAFLAISVHKWLFLAIRQEHEILPKFVPLFYAQVYQKFFGQGIGI